mmetsp:Transcript_101317/g.180074  ORF Transcript_101317/g.180074 Transcript_101317/m.180074 type:complete len:148 (+) Transcript_101317:83-526(+)|eukprot:CAMPEP_0197628126 /NCGR_PEP_ID=MMETSP1338-20131121/6539_1 /TAXON_ID=43686 ORGANISM="Pelagodinium beii, Strain RCC1491" /NCGR_SAMPLE_ID=MMETSP1338 /ASSEMBLY_ACC=CAM_ASM_000754 /LENGTH=147 /DNA_ID=CAMNT_0043199035 /DNA_START=76 /DNA_END=519 /DNA_ORIENTATION=-
MKASKTSKPHPKKPRLKVGLKIRKQWLDKILSGKKTWELRSLPTHKIKEHVGLIEVGAPARVGLVGQVEIVGCIKLGHRTPSGQWKSKPGCTIRKTFKKHGCKSSDITALGYNVLYAWVLRGAKRFQRPKPIKAASQCVVWQNLKLK